MNGDTPGAISVMLACGVTEPQVIALAALRLRIQDRRCDELTLEYCRYEFLKWLWTHGRIGRDDDDEEPVAYG